jgi:hypothetical protein
MKSIRLQKWEQFGDALQEVEKLKQGMAKKYPGYRDSTLFRGVGCFDWGLEKTLERAYPNGNKRKN